MTIEIYWNDFATEYNLSDEEMIPCINHQGVI